MSVFTIADLHLSFGVNKPMDIFTGWKNYTELIEKNWRKLVNENDAVVIAGDVSWGMTLEESKPDFAFLHNLPGTKILLKGNHDYWWNTKNKMDSFLDENGLTSIKILNNNAFEADGKVICGTRGWLYNSASDEDVKIMNREAGRLNLSLDAGEKLDGEKVVFLHYPPVYDTMECKTVLDVMLERGIKRCYYGHIHGKHAAKKAPTGEYKGIKLQLVSCDYVQFMPVLVT